MRIRILLSLALAVLAAGLAPAAFAQQLFYIHTDHLNTPRLVTDGSGTPVWRWDQVEPFGDNLPNEDPDGNGTPGHMPLRFPGQYFDKETNLAYNYFRDYDAAIGRYVQSDPIGLSAGLNTFSYVDSTPLSGYDPQGLAKVSQRARECNSSEAKECERICGSKGVESCKMPQIFRLVQTVKGLWVYEWRDTGNMSCSCNEVPGPSSAFSCNANCQKVWMAIGAIIVMICTKIPVPIP